MNSSNSITTQLLRFPCIQLGRAPARIWEGARYEAFDGARCGSARRSWSRDGHGARKRDRSALMTELASLRRGFCASEWWRDGVRIEDPSDAHA